jgi:hypothetical protein
MYVCMYVCMYACVYVCLYVCIDIYLGVLLATRAGGVSSMAGAPCEREREGSGVGVCTMSGIYSAANAARLWPGERIVSVFVPLY